MKIIQKRLFISAFLFLVAYEVTAQGVFRNLNFESAKVSGNTPGSLISIGNGFPDWSATVTAALDGTQPVSQVYYDNLALGGFMLAINDQNVGFGFEPLQGHFSAYIAGGEGASLTLQQTATVPPGTKSLLVDVQTTYFNLVTTLGGQTIPMIPLSQNPNFTIYGADIPAFAGQILQLSFTEPNTTGLGAATIDDIVFSPNAIPEPSTWALLLCGTGFLGLMCHARKTRA